MAENRILQARIKGRLRSSEGEKATLAEIAKRLGGKALADIDWCGEAGHPCGSVSEADRAEVRPFQTARILGAPAIGAGSRGAGGETPEPPKAITCCVFSHID